MLSEGRVEVPQCKSLGKPVWDFPKQSYVDAFGPGLSLLLVVAS